MEQGNYGWVALVLVLGIGVLIVALVRSHSRKPRTLVDYMLVWPLLIDLERQRNPDREGPVFTAREWIGWGLVGLLMVLVVIYEVLSEP